MSIVLSIYKPDSAFREVVLTDRGNTRMQVLVERNLFHLPRDIFLNLEKDEDAGWKLTSGNYKIRKKNSKEDLTETAIYDGLSLDIIIEQRFKITILVYEQQHPLCVYKKYALNDNDEITFGSNPNNAVQYVLENYVTHDAHCTIQVKNGKAYLIDRSVNGTYLNYRRVPSQKDNPNARPTLLKVGDSIRIFRLNIIYLGNMIAVYAQDGMSISRTPLTAEEISEYTVAEPPSGIQNSDKEFHRAPRIIPAINEEPVEIEAPPAAQNADPQPLFMTIGPAFTMTIPMLLSGGVTLWLSRKSGSATSPFMYTGIITAIAAAFIGVMWAILNVRNQKKRMKKAEEKRQERYRSYLTEISDRLESDSSQNAMILNRTYISALAACEMNEDSVSLWNRNATHEDFMSYRIGIGDIDFQEEISIPKERFSLVDDDLADRPRQIRDQFRTLKNVPVLLDVRKERLVGIIGKKSRVEAVDMARSIIAQIVTANCYTDVKIALVYDENDDVDREAWDFMKWFPHVWSEDRKIRFIATNQDEMGDVFFAMSQIFRHRIEENSFSDRGILKPQYILIVSNPKLVEESIISTYVFDRNQNIGLSTIFLADMYRNLPNDCECIINCANNTISYTKSSKERGIPVELDQVSNERVLALAKRLGNIRVSESGEEGEIPTMLTFFDMYDVGGPEELRAAERWRHADPTATLKAMIGYKTGNRPCYLDLNEKYHGPHGLVAGTTGSGKSETLQTYILSMAVSYSPEDVGFFIIDYKGGGMANLFAGLPHLIGSISNLSGNQVHRAMVSINSEITRRQMLFNEYGVNKIDAYTSMYKNHEAKEPLPHLLIIIDEFAEMKREKPDFMRELVSVAQVGRSLGVHLILATQRPAGAVDGNIWSNSRFKLCLRVQNREDSMEMLHKPDAAFLTQTGRCYLQVGSDEVYDLFQSGWSGASYDKELGGRNLLIAQILSGSGKVDLVGNVARIRLKEKRQQEWIGDLIRILEETADELGEDISARTFSFLSRAEFADLFYKKAQREYPEFERSQATSMRIDDFVTVCKAVKEMNSGRITAPLVIAYAAQMRKHLPEVKSITQLETVVDYLRRTAERAGIPEIRKLWLPPLPSELYLEDRKTFRENCFDGNRWPDPPRRFQLQAVVGYGDAPENQAQMDVGIDFTNGMHHMICGMISSGKSTFLQTAVYSLCMTYAPSMLNLYLIDFSTQLLTVFDGVAHIGGILTENDVETDHISKFFMLMRKIMAERKRKYAAAKLNFADYTNKNGWDEPAIVIVIDNYGSFREKTREMYDSDMMEIAKNGIGYGIYLMITGGGIGMSDIPSRIADCIKTGIALEMTEVYDYTEILRCGKPDVLPESNVHGRGLILNNEKVIEFQTALAAKNEDGEDRNELIQKKLSEMNAAWNGPCARQIPKIPEKPVRKEFVRMENYTALLDDKRYIAAGYNADDADVYALDLLEQYITVVMGARASGKSVFMKNIILTCLDRDEDCMIFETGGGRDYSGIAEDYHISRATDSEAVKRMLSDIYQIMRARIPLKKEGLAERLSEEEMFEKVSGTRRLNVFIADFGSFIKEIYDNTSPAYDSKNAFELIAEVGRFYNIFLYIEVKDADQNSLKAEPIVREIIENSRGLRFGGRLNDSKQVFYSFDNVKIMNQGAKMPPGNAVVACDDSSAPIEKIVVPLYRG